MQCKRCGTNIDTRIREVDGSVVCPRCGAVYRPKTKPQQEQPVPRPEERQGNQQYSRQSAEAVQHPAQPTNERSEQKKPKPKKRKKRVFPIVLLVVLLLAGSAAGGLFAYQKYFDGDLSWLPSLQKFSVPFGSSYTITFSLGYPTSDHAPESQIVERGGKASEPSSPVRDGFVFLGWYSEQKNSLPFNFEQAINANITLSAKWFDPADTQDSDGDGLADAVETTIGTNVNNQDTDGDGLSDYIEFKVLGLDPLSVDTGSTGTPDGQKDSDNDGLINESEISHSTNPLLPDSDRDGLSDNEEVATYKTSPIDPDSDHDGVDDKTEIQIGSDPLKAEESFVTTINQESYNEVNPVGISVAAETDCVGAGTLEVYPVASTNIPALSAASCGYLGTPYEIQTIGNLKTATLTFFYDPSLGSVGDEFIPCIYYYDEESGQLVELANYLHVIYIIYRICTFADFTLFDAWVSIGLSNVFLTLNTR